MFIENLHVHISCYFWNALLIRPCVLTFDPTPCVSLLPLYVYSACKATSIIESYRLQCWWRGRATDAIWGELPCCYLFQLEVHRVWHLKWHCSSVLWKKINCDYLLLIFGILVIYFKTVKNEMVVNSWDNNLLFFFNQHGEAWRKD